MAANAPVVYIFHGDDEYSISRNLTGIKTKMGDSSIADLNTTFFDGRIVDLDTIATACMAMPFISDRRLVIVNHASAPGDNPATRKKYLDLLAGCPKTTALILIEDKVLTDYQMEKRGVVHWLEAWGREEGSRVLIRKFMVPTGKQLVEWIIKRVEEKGGEISVPAANDLAGQVGENLRSLDQELNKLLSFVNFERKVEIEDVEVLAINENQESIFNLVDSIGNRDRQAALSYFHKLLLNEDAASMFGMIVRQFRLLLLAKEILERGGSVPDIARKQKIPGFVAEKISGQTRKFSMKELMEIYHQLLEIDESMKTGVMEVDLNVDLLIDRVTRENSR